MEDAPLLELREEIKKLEKQDASHVSGFATAAKIFLKIYENDGTPIQKCLLLYMVDELTQLYNTKTENGKFKHIVK